MKLSSWLDLDKIQILNSTNLGHIFWYQIWFSMILCIIYFSTNSSYSFTRYKYTVSILFVGGLKDIFIQTVFNLTIIIERKRWDTYSCCEYVISYRLNKKLRHFFALRRCACEFPFTTLINYVHGMKVYNLCIVARRIHHYKLIPR